MDDTQPTHVNTHANNPSHHDDAQPERLPNLASAKTHRERRPCCSCFLVNVSIFLILAILGWIFFVTKGRSNILILGIDSRENSNLGRSDTIILTTIDPSRPYIGMLSIPRDLWVTVPEYGPNRINTAHFFGEADLLGSGPEKAMTTVRSNFGVDVDYYLRLNHVGFLFLIDYLGGIDIELEDPVLGLNSGINHLTGEQALALVRDRSESDDFSRMQQGQIFVRAFLNQMISIFINPVNWPKIPETVAIITNNMDSNIPIWLLPQYGYTLLRVGFDQIDARVLGRDLVIPFTTSGGAAVLEPNWDKINPVLLEMFGQ